MNQLTRDNITRKARDERQTVPHSLFSLQVSQPPQGSDLFWGEIDSEPNYNNICTGTFYNARNQLVKDGSPLFQVDLNCSLASVPYAEPGNIFVAYRKRGQWYILALYEDDLLSSDAWSSNDPMSSDIEPSSDQFSSNTWSSNDPMSSDIEPSSDTWSSNDPMSSAIEPSSDAWSSDDPMSSDIEPSSDELSSDAWSSNDPMSSDIEPSSDAWSSDDPMSSNIEPSSNELSSDAWSSNDPMSSDIEPSSDAWSSNDPMSSDIEPSSDEASSNEPITFDFTFLDDSSDAPSSDELSSEFPSSDFPSSETVSSLPSSDALSSDLPSSDALSSDADSSNQIEPGYYKVNMERYADDQCVLYIGPETACLYLTEDISGQCIRFDPEEMRWHKIISIEGPYQYSNCN